MNLVLLPDHVEEEAKILSIYFYKTTKARLILFYFLSVLTIGIIPLLCYWKRPIYAMLRYTKAQAKDCQYVVIRGTDNVIEHKAIQVRTLTFGSESKVYRSFMHRLYNYYYDEEMDLFKACQFSLKGKTYTSIHIEIGKGLPSMREYTERLFVYGPNTMDLPVKSNLGIFIKEVISPFYFFQLFAVIFWAFFSNYPIYAGILLGLSILTLTLTFFKIKTNYNELRRKAYQGTEVTSYQPVEEGKIITQVPKKIDSRFLVPGDIVEIAPRTTIPCDILLLSGTCIMNESMLVGESELVIKKALPDSSKKFDLWSAENHTLFGGTECMETAKAGSEPQIIGVVIRTGFSTMKGRLIRSYLFSKRENFQFYRDVFRYVVAMFLIAVICFIFTIKVFVDFGAGAGEIIGKALDTIVIAVPPVLPSCITIGLFLASMRLEKKGVLARSELKINVTGKVQIACFDKTGTLTEDSLSLHGVRSVHNTDDGTPEFQCIVKEDICSFLSVPNLNTANGLLLELLATCHNLTMKKGVLTGNPIDLKIFRGLGWEPTVAEIDRKFRLETLDYPNELLNDDFYIPRAGVEIIKRFLFSPKLKRTTVIIKTEKEKKQRIHVKGLPKIIKRLSNPNTLPIDYEDIISEYTQNGFSVIACASKLIEDRVRPSDNIAREFYEKDLEFLGFLIFENKVREKTPEVISKLISADIIPIMLSDDSPSSGYYAAKACGIIGPDEQVILAGLNTMETPMLAPKIEWTTMEQLTRPKRSGVDSERSETIEDQLKIEFDDVNYSTKGLLSPTEHLKMLKSIKDNANTCIAFSGDAFRHLASTVADNRTLYHGLLKKARLFTQLHPDDKALIIKEFQKLGYIVAMCGDGPNDCPALKIANVSLALNNNESNEASFAASFASKVKDITSMDILLREGRSALLTSYQCFKYMSIYAIVQTLSMVISYANESDLPDASYLYQDLFVVLPTAMAILLTHPGPTLSKKQPSGALLSPQVICSILGQFAILAITHAVAVSVLHKQEWYVSPADLTAALQEETGDNEAEAANYDSTVLFFIGNIQLITMIFLFSVGLPFRQPFYKNWVFTGIWVINLVCSVLIIVVPVPEIIQLLETKDFDPDQSFRWVIFGIAVANVVVSTLHEKYFASWILAGFSRLFKGKKYLI